MSDEDEFEFTTKPPCEPPEIGRIRAAAFGSDAQFEYARRICEATGVPPHYLRSDAMYGTPPGEGALGPEEETTAGPSPEALHGKAVETLMEGLNGLHVNFESVAALGRAIAELVEHGREEARRADRIEFDIADMRHRDDKFRAITRAAGLAPWADAKVAALEVALHHAQRMIKDQHAQIETLQEKAITLDQDLDVTRATVDLRDETIRRERAKSDGLMRDLEGAQWRLRQIDAAAPEEPTVHPATEMLGTIVATLDRWDIPELDDDPDARVNWLAAEWEAKRKRLVPYEAALDWLYRSPGAGPSLVSSITEAAINGRMPFT